MIPLYIFHLGNQLYFQKCVAINSTRNFVYIIGDDSNKDTFKDNNCVIHVHIDSFKDSLETIQRMKQCFVNYSTLPHTYELNCFLRVFYLKELMKRTKIDSFFHIDSDCILLEKIKKIPFRTKIAYSLITFSQLTNPYCMGGSIHNGLVNNEFCDAFIQLCFDIYENKTKFHLIEPKIQWHTANNIPGGICDMTLYYLLYSEKIVDVSDLNELYSISGDCTFDHNIHVEYGYNGENTYRKSNGIKEIIRHGDRFCFRTNEDKLVYALSRHFQGGAKRILETLNVSDW